MPKIQKKKENLRVIIKKNICLLSFFGTFVQRLMQLHEYKKFHVSSRKYFNNNFLVLLYPICF